jgi:formylmethanofuran dehydrogenase subunit E
MLEESGWSLNGTKPIDTKREPSIRPMTPDEIMYEILRQRKRDEEKFRSYYRPTSEQDFKSQYEGSWTYDPYTGNKEKPKKEKRPLECTQCHQMVETAYVGNLFVCHKCVWDNYTKL